MQRRIPQHQENPTIHRQPHTIAPQRQHIEAKRREDHRAGDLDIEAVLLVLEGEIAHFVDDEAFEAVVKYR